MAFCAFCGRRRPRGPATPSVSWRWCPCAPNLGTPTRHPQPRLTSRSGVVGERGAHNAGPPVTVYQDLHRIIVAAIRDLQVTGSLPPDLPLTDISVAPPGDPLHGHLSTNAALVLARHAGQNPRVLAEALAAKLRAEAGVESATVAGPGFLNLTLLPSIWQAVIPARRSRTASSTSS